MITKKLYLMVAVIITNGVVPPIVLTGKHLYQLFRDFILDHQHPERVVPEKGISYSELKE